jgi:hypothetical protein
VWSCGCDDCNAVLLPYAEHLSHASPPSPPPCNCSLAGVRDCINRCGWSWKGDRHPAFPTCDWPGVEGEGGHFDCTLLSVCCLGVLALRELGCVWCDTCITCPPTLLPSVSHRAPPSVAGGLGRMCQSLWTGTCSTTHTPLSLECNFCAQRGRVACKPANTLACGAQLPTRGHCAAAPILHDV